MENTETFLFSDENKVHVLKLKRRNYWWLLLLLLLFLPLLLLIRFKKDIIFKTVNASDMSVLSGTMVNFKYTDHSFFEFKTKSFFSSQIIKYNDSTNNDGVVVFKKVSYSLYSVLFHSNEDCYVSATNQCFMGDSIQQKFSSLKDKEITLLKLPERSYTLEFKVVDAQDNQPIPEAKVELSIANKVQGEKFSSADGTVVFEKVPYCQTIEITASKYGYENEKINDKVSNLYSNEQKRVLKLKPIKKMINFLVKDLLSQQPVPNAKAFLVIEKDTIKTTTNTNGVGKGAFENVHIIKTMKIKVSKTFYYDTVSNSYVVEKYINLSEKERTIYIRPKTQKLEFYNINGSTGAKMEGVENKIFINGTLKGTETSNVNGTFAVTELRPDDKISITASKNGFVTNSSKVANIIVSSLDNNDKRTIPLNVTPPPPPPPPIKKDEFKGESGDLRVNLQWETLDDLDLFVTDPCGNTVWALNLSASCGGGVGTLDIDANTNRYSQSTWTKTPQENAFWEKPSLGKYKIQVEHCIKQDFDKPDPVKFNITIIYKGVRSDYKGQVTEKAKVFVTNYEVK